MLPNPYLIIMICFSLSSRLSRMYSSAFVIFYVDTTNEIVYYLPLQDYFISHPTYFDKLDSNKNSINIHIPSDNIVSEEDFDLQQIAKSVYVDGPSRKLHKAI